ncbi:MAG: hypothetical protein K6L80_12145 [Agarilytica sp.]
MASGKQILLSVLTDLSQSETPLEALEDSTAKFISAFMVHASTSDENWNFATKFKWLSQSDEDGLVRQGVGLEKGSLFLSDFVEKLTENSQIIDSISASMDGYTSEDVESCLSFIWYLLSANQYWQELTSVENGGVLEQAERELFIRNYKDKLNNYRNERS